MGNAFFMKTLITKSNYLVEAGYKLTLNEQRLVLSAISQLDGRKPISKDNDFCITAIEFADMFDIPVKRVYEILEDTAARLYERDIQTFDKKEKIRRKFRWVDGIKYWDGEAKITLSFSRHIIPYLTMLHEQFTTYDLKQISKLKTSYSIRFYELLVQFIKTGKREIRLDKLRKILEINKQYPRFYDLKKYVIEPSILEIRRLTDLTVEWDIIKTGRSITGLIFIFEKKQSRKNAHLHIAKQC